jgi:ABC-2 type transport system ATP-binding protein
VTTPESTPTAAAAAPGQPAVVCRLLNKVYPGGVVALRELSLTIPLGASFGLLGENGAGKSTLVHLLMGFIAPTAGTLSVFGTPPTSAHPRVGYLHERPVFEPRFSGREHLSYLAALSGLRGPNARARVESLLDLVHLAPAAERRTGGYSKGMLQRLAIAAALLNDPDLLILDEPTSGLDPLAQYEMRQVIAALTAQRKTILLCSHYLAEVETLCDTVGILRAGRLVSAGTVSELLRSAGTVEIELAGDVPAAAVTERLGLAAEVPDTTGARMRIPAASQSAVLAALLAANVPIRSLNPLTESLEDLYVRVAAGPAAVSRPSAGRHHASPQPVGLSRTETDPEEEASR